MTPLLERPQTGQTCCGGVFFLRVGSRALFAGIRGEEPEFDLNRCFTALWCSGAKEGRRMEQKEPFLKPTTILIACGLIIGFTILNW